MTNNMVKIPISNNELTAESTDINHKSDDISKVCRCK